MSGEITHATTDQELSAQLHEFLVVRGEPEVDIVENGKTKTINQAEYREAIRLSKLSPANRVLEKQRLRNQFLNAIAEAKVYVIDIDADGNYGKDINGKQIPINGREFLPPDQYVDGVAMLKNELGAFVDPYMFKDPIRLVSK